MLSCTGKVYYDLIKERRDKGLDEQIAIHTVEQICPFPFDMMKQASTLVPSHTVTKYILPGGRPILQCQAVLGSGRAQEHGGLVLRTAQDTDSYWGIPQV